MTLAEISKMTKVGNTNITEAASQWKSSLSTLTSDILRLSTWEGRQLCGSGIWR